MSYAIEERYDVYTLTWRKARKAHACDACGEAISAGHRYCVASWVFDGDADSVKRCAKCETLHDHLRELGDGESWPDERLACGLDYEREWGELPDEIAALAFMTPDEAQKLVKAEGDRG